MATVGELRAEVGAGSTISDAQLQRFIDLATELVNAYTASAGVEIDPDTGDEIPIVVPALMVDQALLACAVELFNLRQAPNGVLNQQYEAFDGGAQSIPIRISGDPMRPVRPLLAPWIGGLTT